MANRVAQPAPAIRTLGAAPGEVRRFPAWRYWGAGDCTRQPHLPELSASVRARRAHARFKVRDLREQTRARTIFGTQVFFRIEVEPAPNDLIPLVVVHDVDTGRYSAWPAWPKSPGVWEYAVMRGYPPESVFFVYLIRR